MSSALGPRWLLALLGAAVAVSLVSAGGALAAIAGIGDRAMPARGRLMRDSRGT